MKLEEFLLVKLIETEFSDRINENDIKEWLNEYNWRLNELKILKRMERQQEFGVE
tara:strand:+ start:367 stop:531 length:165 start_codon:yes stop_codon:yes gene_type:complete